MRKTQARPVAARKASARQATRKSDPVRPAKPKPVAVETAVRTAPPIRPAAVEPPVAPPEPRAVPIGQVTARAPAMQTHKFQVGQTVLFTSSPITRPGASGSYQVVKLLPSDGEDYQYRIKNSGEAFERVAKESQLELEH